MIRNPKTPLPIVVFDTSHTWSSLRDQCRSYLDDFGLQKLQNSLDGFVKTVVIEHEYIDKDYRDTFSKFHSKKFNTPDSRCIRLHFFTDKITDGQLRKKKNLQGKYVGYSIIRPIRPNCIGRTLLDPRKLNISKGYMCLCKEQVVICGRQFDLEGFPFISQDSDATVCAQSALWMLLRYFSNKYSHYHEIYPSQITDLTKDYSIGRIIPSSGLYVWQMAEVLRKIDFAPLIYTRINFPKDFIDFLYTYIESGFPLLVSIPNHVVVTNGHRSNFLKPIPTATSFDSSHYFDGLFINDDNLSPYRCLEQLPSPGVNYSLGDVDSFIVPLPEKVFLPVEHFKVLTKTLLNSPEFGISNSPTLTGKQHVFRFFLTSCQSFKKKIEERNMGNATVLNSYRYLPLPHFIWVCEISTSALFPQGDVLGDIIWDATRNAYEQNCAIAVHYPEILFLDVGSAFNGHNKHFIKVDLTGSKPYTLYRNNLMEVG